MAAGLPLNGKTPKELSDRFPTYITPAGYTFGIWGLIYLFLTLFVLYQFFPSTLGDPYINEGVGLIFILNAILNMSWIVSWHYQTPGNLWISLVLITGILVTLLVIYHRLVSVTTSDWLKQVCVFTGFSMYLGWLSVATLVNAFTVFGIYPRTQDGRGMDPLAAEWIGNTAMILVILFSLYFGIYRHVHHSIHVMESVLLIYIYVGLIPFRALFILGPW